MIPEIKKWNQEEAKEWFKKIESRIQEAEWLEWKFKLNPDPTTDTNRNTLHRAVSGFANTQGGVIVIGFKDDGTFVGIDRMNSIKNYLGDTLKIKPSLPSFDADYYNYKDSQALVIFVYKSQKLLQCDDGRFYFRRQSQFDRMGYSKIEQNFRESFEETKNIDLVINELRRFVDYLKFGTNEALRNGGGIVSYKTTTYTRHLIDSEGSLYHYYNRLDLFYSLQELLRLINIWNSGEGDIPRKASEFSTLLEKVQEFLRLLEQSKNKENASLH